MGEPAPYLADILLQNTPLPEEEIRYFSLDDFAKRIEQNENNERSQEGVYGEAGSGPGDEAGVDGGKRDAHQREQREPAHHLVQIQDAIADAGLRNDIEVAGSKPATCSQ
jgi:hypothetical protein